MKRTIRFSMYAVTIFVFMMMNWQKPCVNYNQHNRSAAQKNPVNKTCLLLVFSVPTERAAIATGNDLRGLGICHQQAFSRNSGNGISAKYAILRKIALLASSLAPCIDILSSLVLYCYTQQHNS